MKKSKKIIAIIAILISILLAFVGGQAYAKYITEVRGEGVAEIATWNFNVNGSKEQIHRIELTSTYNDGTLAGNKIGPGTKGAFNITIDATDSEVGIDYKVAIIEEQNKPQNLKFIYAGKKYDTVEELGEDLSGTIGAKDVNKQKSINIEWIWEYETGDTEEEIALNDIKDTQDAEAMQDYTFIISVTGTQVEPQ